MLIIIGLFLSVLLGGITVAYFNATNKSQATKLTLAFSGGFLLAIIFQHLIPDIYHDNPISMGSFILIGFLIQLVLEFFSGGIEHGHVHTHSKNKIPWVLFISLCVHSIIEGIPLGNFHVGIESEHAHQHDSLFWGIVFHQFPVAVALMTLLLLTEQKKWISWLFLFSFAIMTPIGFLIGLKFSPEQLGFDVHTILAIVVGMFLHISTTIIFETSENHKFNFMKLFSILIGVGIAMLIYN